MQDNDETMFSHTRADCSLHDSPLQKTLTERVREVNEVFKMANYSGCFRCKLPQKMCNPKACEARVKKQAQNGEHICLETWIHVVMDAWVFCTEYSPITTPMYQEQLRKLGLHQSSPSEIMTYFGAKIRTRAYPEIDGDKDGMETTRLVEWLVDLTEHGFTRVTKPPLGRLRR
jgi:hypothetical protein